MKATGIVRRIDALGRIVLPKELRKVMDIKDKDPIEIFVSEDKIILGKYQPACTFCGNLDDIEIFKDKKVCNECMTEIRKNHYDRNHSR